MTFNPDLWLPGKDPAQVSRDFDMRHGGPGSTPPPFMWAVWAAESSHYLGLLDDAPFTGGDSAWPIHPRTGLVDMSHVRWATGNAITAVDLCAATIGHVFRLKQGQNELSLTHFDEEPYKRKRRRWRLGRRECRRRRRLREVERKRREVERRRASLTPEFRGWVDETLADQDYKLVRRMRNPFIHAALPRHLYAGTDPVTGHTDRTKFPAGKSAKIDSRELVEKSAKLALDRVRAFIAVLDAY